LLFRLNNVLNSANHSDQERHAPWRNLLDLVFGYDFFISYSWRDGIKYSAALAQRLEKEHFAVFLDRANYAAGDDWKKVGGWTLRRTGQLLLVGSPSAVFSDAVLQEVRVFSKTGRRIIPIDFDGSIEFKASDSPLRNFLPPEVIRVKENLQALDIGPTDETVAAIRQTFDLILQYNKRLTWLLLIAFVLGILTLISIYTSILSSIERANALRNESASLATVSDIALKEGQPIDALQLALAAWPRKGDDARPKLRQVVSALISALSADQERGHLEGHRDSVRSADFSPNGSRIVTASTDKTVRIWDAKTRKLLRILESGDGPVLSATFSPDGARIVAASEKNVQIWNADTGEHLATLAGHRGLVWSAAFNPDGTQIVTASEDATALIWDAKAGVVLTVLKGHQGPVYFARFNRNGTRIVTASEDNTARIWDVKTGECLVRLNGHTDKVYSAEFDPDATRVVTASEDKTARIWDSRTGQNLSVLELKEGANVVRYAAFSPEGARVITASFDNIARIWDATSGAVLVELKGHLDGVNFAAFSSDGTRVVTASDDSSARIWDTTPVLTELKGHGGYVYSVAFSQDSRRVVTASRDKTARIWDAVSGAFILKLNHSDYVTCAEFDPSGDRIVTASIGPDRKNLGRAYGGFAHLAQRTYRLDQLFWFQS
jgi:WD40 repeat protein